MRSRFVAAAVALILLSSAALAEGPELGRVATPDEIASWDISVGPDGTGLPSGRGTPKQGEAVYAQGLRPKMCRLPWREGGRQAQRPARRRTGQPERGPGSGKDGRQLLALCHDPV